MSLLAINMQVLFSGLALGSIYALVALGFVLIIRATNVVNFAQGDFAMLGAFAMLTLLSMLGLPYWAALLVGIPVAAMIAITFIYSATLGGLAGILVGPVLFVSIGMGSIIALKAFSATIIGGFGDIKGAIIGGLLLGVVESFGAHYVSVPYKDAFAFLLLFIFLLFRPQGLFGERISEKA